MLPICSPYWLLRFHSEGISTIVLPRPLGRMYLAKNLSLIRVQVVSCQSTLVGRNSPILGGVLKFYIGMPRGEYSETLS